MLFITTFVVAAIFGNIWHLNPDGIIWSIIFYPPAFVCGILSLIILDLYLFKFDCYYNPY